MHTFDPLPAGTALDYSSRFSHLSAAEILDDIKLILLARVSGAVVVIKMEG